ncbi:MAG: rod shape-determining protein RodA [Candidatus Omnitrophica bacterium]|nr:rod shape-determining protein RodA [Candidatus Omnitrophota bacterium]
MNGSSKRQLGKFDFVIFLATVFLSIFGLFCLYSAAAQYFSKAIILRQAIWLLAGLLIFCVALFIDYRKIVNFSYLFYGITILLLILVLAFGQTRGGSHRWINLGLFNLQPSELAKIALVFALSTYLGHRKRDSEKPSFVVGAALITLPVFCLILIEPDLGTALLLLPTALALLFIGGAKLRYLISIALASLLCVPVFWHFLKDYQKERLLVFINPNIDPLGAGYTIIQSKIAIGSGGIFGKGWLSGTQNTLNFLPERHTDFIFSVVGEEWGLLGCLVFVFLYCLIVYRGLRIVSLTSDIYGKLIATGFITIFAVQSVVNIAMTIGLSPVVGLTLPLVSYGGSSLIITLFSLGVVLNIGMRRSLF